MNSKLLMSASALFMALLGAGATFAPQELLRHYGINDQSVALLFVQAAGALYLGFAVLNWMARANLIGGIYSRPVALGNLVHFALVAITLLKVVIGGTQRNSEILVACIVYSLFALSFGWIAFVHPAPAK
jgi:hypothetical protein